MRAFAYITGLVKKYNGFASILEEIITNFASALREHPRFPEHALSCSLQAQSRRSIQGPSNLPPANL